MSSETQIDSNNVTLLQETITKQQNEISELREKINSLKQLLLRAHQHITESNKRLNETKEQLQATKQENIELQQKIAKMERQLVSHALEYNSRLNFVKIDFFETDSGICTESKCGRNCQHKNSRRTGETIGATCQSST